LARVKKRRTYEIAKGLSKETKTHKSKGVVNMLDVALGQTSITLGEMLLIIVLTTGILYFFTNCTVKTLGLILWGIFCWVALIAICLGVPIGLGIKFVMWIFT
jgi:hypothetical protein